MCAEEYFKVFETKHNLRIILYLLLVGPGTKSDIYDAVSTNPRMPDKISMLEKHGLIVSKRYEGELKDKYRLTALGREWGDHLAKMIEEMGWSLAEIRRSFLKCQTAEIEFEDFIPEDLIRYE